MWVVTELFYYMIVILTIYIWTSEFIEVKLFSRLPCSYFMNCAGALRKQPYSPNKHLWDSSWFSISRSEHTLHVCTSLWQWPFLQCRRTKPPSTSQYVQWLPLFSYLEKTSEFKGKWNPHTQPQPNQRSSIETVTSSFDLYNKTNTNLTFQ